MGERGRADRRVEELEADVRYRRERLALYRARAYSGRPTTERRLRELQQAADQAEQRLRNARTSASNNK